MKGQHKAGVIDRFFTLLQAERQKLASFGNITINLLASCVKVVKFITFSFQVHNKSFLNLPSRTLFIVCLNLQLIKQIKTILSSSIKDMQRLWQSIKKMGSRLCNRTSSVQISSKTKKNFEEKKALSIDSKQKLLNLQKSGKVLPPAEVQVLDHNISVNAGKKLLDQSLASVSALIGMNVSVQDNKSETTNLLKDLSQYSASHETVISKPSKTKIGGKILPNIYEGNRASSKRKRLGKILIEKEKSAVKVKRVQEICAICKQTVAKKDSLKLACLHRYHKACEKKMQWRMNYSCDLCSRRGDKVSIKFNK